MNVRFTAFLAAVAAVAAGSAAALPKVHPDVHRTLRQQGSIDLIVVLTETTESVVNNIKESDYATRTDRINALKSQLVSANKHASSEIESLLTKEAAGGHNGYKNFWITNQVFISGASFDLVEQLSGLASVSEIREERSYPVPTPQVADESKELVGQETSIIKIGAPQIWADGNIG
ncbi:hypothetical protein Gpo141_00008729, partial [Globisporangium polare]